MPSMAENGKVEEIVKTGVVHVKKYDDQPLESTYSKHYGGRTEIGRVHLTSDEGKSMIGMKVTVCGWVRQIRDQADITFIEVNDGSCQRGMQCVVDSTCVGFDTIKGNVNTGASVRCTGVLVESPAKGQVVELSMAEGKGEISVIGPIKDAKEYPLPNTKISLEVLREKAHLRPRTHMFGCVARVRSSLAYATHEFFRQQGFLYIHTPLITASDCEGAGEMFQVTTLLDQYEKEPGTEGHRKWPAKPEYIDYKKDFFKKKAYLSVSGQLAVENFCCALSNVYTFGPTFRAENSSTKRHLAEFWMIEPELAFADIWDDMQCAEDYLKFCVRYVMENNKQDLEFFQNRVEKGLVKRLENLVESPFGRLSYTEAIELMTQEVANGNFQKYLDEHYQQEKKSWDEWRVIEWGMDLNSSHEKYLAEVYYKKPVVVYNYPAKIKAFYMRSNDEEDEEKRTVAAMDVLAPLVGEVIGGSQREERLEKLDSMITGAGLNVEDYWWYRELRKYGTVPHAGFGLGFDRLVMLTTGMENIRDVIPFPRYPGHAEF